MWLRLSKNHSFLFDEVITCTYRLHNNNSHRNKSLINHKAFFDILIKHKENEAVRKKVFVHLEGMYRERTLKDEHKVFYDYYPMQSFPERFIKNNYHPKLYRIALEVQKFLYYFRIFINGIFSKQ
jgi:hypothetical protein